MSTAGDLLADAARTLDKAGIPEARREARMILAHVVGLDPASLFNQPERAISGGNAHLFAALLARRAAREPWSRIVGTREFWSLSFRLSPDTLDPRPDSETLVQAALDRIPDRAAPLRLLDLGTGSGCLLLALLSELPDATGLGIDISPGAVESAALNARELGLDARATFRVGDWLNAVEGRFDLVIVNPPYIPAGEIPALEAEVRDWDPRHALDGGPDGLDAIRVLAPELANTLTDQGFIAMEVGAGQAQAAATICHRAGLDPEAPLTDLSGVERCLVMRRTRGR